MQLSDPFNISKSAAAQKSKIFKYWPQNWTVQLNCSTLKSARWTKTVSALRNAFYSLWLRSHWSLSAFALHFCCFFFLFLSDAAHVQNLRWAFYSSCLALRHNLPKYEHIFSKYDLYLRLSTTEKLLFVLREEGLDVKAQQMENENVLWVFLSFHHRTAIGFYVRRLKNGPKCCITNLCWEGVECMETLVWIQYTRSNTHTPIYGISIVFFYSLISLLKNIFLSQSALPRSG